MSLATNKDASDSNKIILVCGAGGFIGSHLADRLLSEEHKVLVIDNYQTARRDNLVPHQNLKVVDGTIADKRLVDELFHEFQPEENGFPGNRGRTRRKTGRDQRGEAGCQRHHDYRVRSYGCSG